MLCIFRPFSGWHLRLKSYIRNTCNTSPVIDVVRARAYTSIREVLLQVLQFEHLGLKVVSFEKVEH